MSARCEREDERQEFDFGGYFKRQVTARFDAADAIITLRRCEFSGRWKTSVRRSPNS